MGISVDQLLKKIESELHKAKQVESLSKLRENVHSIKILCELILEENETDFNRGPTGMKSSGKNSEVLAPSPLSSKKLDMEEEANGDSLFDF